MVDQELFHGEPVGHPQEIFGAHVVENCTHTALDHFFEAKNAAMGPTLNAPGIASHFADDAVMETVAPSSSDGSIVQRTYRGKAEIQRFFEDIAEWMMAITTIEKDRTVSGRKATWTGTISGILTESRERAELDATFRLEFDEHDHVVYQWARFTKPALA